MSTTTASWVISPSLDEQIRTGLTQSGQKEIPCTLLYDEIGSALFEVITLLPEYGLTRAGDRLMCAHSEELVARLRMPLLVAELGSGTGKTTKWLLEALSRRQQTRYCPIEISASALEQCRKELGSVPGVAVSGFQMEYLDGLSDALELRRPGTHVLVLFLGSTIGNLPHDHGISFLQELRRLLNPGDALLLATDLMKPVGRIQKAYDDPTGVTAAFNLNILARLNREYGADFVLEQFRHEARWNQAERRIEMHLRSLTAQTVWIAALDIRIRLRAGETIWTESSHKYQPAEIVQMAGDSGFECSAQWVDEEWPFAHSLFEVTNL